MTVGTIAGLLAAGRPHNGSLRAYPYLEADDIRTPLSYAAWRTEEVELRRSHRASSCVSCPEKVMVTRPNPFRGKWRIVSTNVWEAGALDEFGLAYISFGSNRTGELHLIAINASVDYRVGTRDGSPIVEFTWAGDDEGSPTSGRGWARRDPEGLIGQLFIHEGDEAEAVG